MRERGGGSKLARERNVRRKVIKAQREKMLNEKTMSERHWEARGTESWRQRCRWREKEGEPLCQIWSKESLCATFEGSLMRQDTKSLTVRAVSEMEGMWRILKHCSLLSLSLWLLPSNLCHSSQSPSVFLCLLFGLSGFLFMSPSSPISVSVDRFFSSICSQPTCTASLSALRRRRVEINSNSH